jgi:hypothetical protein
MKIIFHDQDKWYEPEWRALDGWAKLYYLYLYDMADQAGFVAVQPEVDRAICKLKEIPDDTKEIATALNGYIKQVKDSLFIVRNYIYQTQTGGKIIPDDPPRVKVLEAMDSRRRSGVPSVGALIREMNPDVEFITTASPSAPHRVNAYNRATEYYKRLKEQEE